MTTWLGRHQRHDPRSRGFPAPTESFVRSAAWTLRGDVLDQSGTMACTGFALAHALNALGKGRLLGRDDALRLYSTATRLDDYLGVYPPDDVGSNGLAVCKAAKAEGLISAYTHAFGRDHAVQALQHGPVIAGFPWYEGMRTPDPAGFVEPTGALVDGHQVALVGVNIAHGYVTAVNSWGPDWGHKGFFRLRFDVLDRLLDQGGDVTCPTR